MVVLWRWIDNAAMPCSMRMREIEAKVLEVDPDAVAETLEGMGAEQGFDGTVRSRFYDLPDRTFKERGEVLRVRERGDYTFLTYKQPVSRDGMKVMEEAEFEVAGLEEADSFLTGIGFDRVEERTKHRTAWQEGDALYVIDRYPGVPPLLEVEAPSGERVVEAFEAVGYTEEDLVSWDAAQVVEHYSVD